MVEDDARRSIFSTRLASQLCRYPGVAAVHWAAGMSLGRMHQLHGCWGLKFYGSFQLVMGVPPQWMIYREKHGNSQSKMDENWVYPRGNLHMLWMIVDDCGCVVDAAAPSDFQVFEGSHSSPHGAQDGSFAARTAPLVKAASSVPFVSACVNPEGLLFAWSHCSRDLPQ